MIVRQSCCWWLSAGLICGICLRLVFHPSCHGAEYSCSHGYSKSDTPMLIIPTEESIRLSLTINSESSRCHVQLTRPSVTRAPGYFVVRLLGSMRSSFTADSELILRDSFLDQSIIGRMLLGSYSNFRRFATKGDSAYLMFRGAAGVTDEVKVQLEFTSDCPPGWLPGKRNVARCFGLSAAENSDSASSSLNIVSFDQALANCQIMRANMAMEFDEDFQDLLSIPTTAGFSYWIGAVLTCDDETAGATGRLLNGKDFQKRINTACGTICPKEPTPVYVRVKADNKPEFHAECRNENAKRAYICSTRRGTGDKEFYNKLSAAAGDSLNEPELVVESEPKIHTDTHYAYLIGAITATAAIIVGAVAALIMAWRQHQRRHRNRRFLPESTAGQVQSRPPPSYSACILHMNERNRELNYDDASVDETDSSLPPSYESAVKLNSVVT